MLYGRRWKKQINERKKRRLPFLWLMVLGVLLGGASWLYFAGTVEKAKGDNQAANHPLPGAENNSTKASGAAVQMQEAALPPATITAGKKQTIEQPEPVKTGKDSKERQEVAHKTAVLSPVLPEKKLSPKIPGENNTAGAGGNSSAIQQQALPAARFSNKNSVVKEDHKRNSHKKIVAEKSFAAEETVASVKIEAGIDHQQAEPPVSGNDKTMQGETPATDSALAASPTVTTALAATDSIKKSTSATDSSAVTKTKSAGKKAKTVDWGISASLGGSNISQGVGGALSASPLYDAAAYRNSSQSSTPGNNNGGSNLNSFTKPANLRSGLAWSLGVFISKPLGKNARLLAGLNYHYYSMGLQVGAKIDSNKALLEYNNGNSTSYTNRFHFIELPVNIEKQLGRDSRFSVNAGLAFSVLAGSNALQYSASKNTYFKDNGYINKAQLGLQAGFSYRLFQKSVGIEAGPQLSYGLSNIFKKELYGSAHLFMAGINARIFFHRNKR